MSNSELVLAFERIADLMEITGADRFRINSYRRASRTIKDTAEDLSVVASENRLGKLPGIGKSTAAKIQQYLDEGRIDLLDELSAKLPEGLPALLDVPGLGPKKVAVLHEKLGVGSLDDLKAAVADDTMKELPGFGATSVKRIADGIEMLESVSDRTPLGVAHPIARELADHLAALEQVESVEIAGSLRRGAEMVGDADLLCASTAGQEVVDAFVSGPTVQRVVGSGPTKGSVTVKAPHGRELRVQLRVVPPESYGAALQYFTGSKEHNVRLRELAIKRGWKLNEWGLFDGEEMIAGPDEQEIYAKLDLPFIPPELREDRDEFAPDFDPSGLITVEDIRGDLHVHTTASDGRNTIEEMALAAQELGYEYLAITDHSKSSAIANGLSIAKLSQHIEDVQAINEQLRGFTLLAGTECDILADGSLDYPDELLAKCDWVVASIHSALVGGRVSPTERTLRAIENKYVSAIGHPTGRLMPARAPMELDMAAVVAAAAETDTALEVNASWQRLDLKDLHIRQALEAGAMLTLNTDAHSTTGLTPLDYGVNTARRGGCPPDRVLNTFSAGRLSEWIARKRSS